MDSTVADLFAPAARDALTWFPIRAGAPELVAVSENVTFRVTDESDGRAYVLRLHRPGYHSLDSLNSERLWTEALGKAGIAVPRAIASHDGRYYVPVSVPRTGEQRFAGMVEWTEGEVLSEVMAREPDNDRLEAWFGQLGHILASMHAQSSQWRTPAGFVRHRLDIEGLMGEAPFWGRFWEHPMLTDRERALMLETREAIRGALSRYGQDRRCFGVIHADLHPGNVLINGDRLTVIDFDDTGFGWHLYDVAVALAHQQGKPRFLRLRDALLAGYRRVRPLDKHTLALLPMFLLIRGMATIGWLHQRPEHSGAEQMAYLQWLRSIVLEHCETFETPC